MVHICAYQGWWYRGSPMTWETLTWEWWLLIDKLTFLPVFACVFRDNVCIQNIKCIGARNNVSSNLVLNPFQKTSKPVGLCVSFRHIRTSYNPGGCFFEHFVPPYLEWLVNKHISLGCLNSPSNHLTMVGTGGPESPALAAAPRIPKQSHRRAQRQGGCDQWDQIDGGQQVVMEVGNGGNPSSSHLLLSQ